MMKFSLITLYVETIEPSLEFYRDLLGMPELRRIETPNGSIVFLGRGDDVELELIETRKGGARYEGFSLGFDVADLAAATKKLAAAGIKKLRGPIAVGESTLLAFFEGPNGEEIELIQH